MFPIEKGGAGAKAVPHCLGYEKRRDAMGDVRVWVCHSELLVLLFLLFLLRFLNIFIAYFFYRCRFEDWQEHVFPFDTDAGTDGC
jgi:hypothetical protein